MGIIPLADAPDSDKWKQIDSMVHTQMVVNMEQALYGELSFDEMTSAQLWTAIIGRFEEHSKLAQNTAHARLCEKRIKEGESMSNHIIELRKFKATYLNAEGTLTSSQWHTIIVTSLDDHSQWCQMNMYVDSIEDPERLIRKLELKELRGFEKARIVETALQAA